MPDTVNTPKNDLRLLDPRKVSLRLNEFGRLCLEVGFEERYAPVRAMRCLPLTNPNRFIAIQDDEGNEIGILTDLTDLDSESKSALNRELDLYYLKADVRAIRKVEARNGVITWDLDTDLGPKTIHVRDRSNIRSLGDGRTVLTDIHQGKYVIPQAEALDERSRHWLEIEL